jgi:membrane-associated phospholipid phosphatase
MVYKLPFSFQHVSALRKWSIIALIRFAAFFFPFLANAQTEDPVKDSVSVVTKEDQNVVKTKDNLPLPNAGPKPHLYRMNYWFSGSFSVVATAANIYAIPNLILNKKEITQAELSSLNRDAVPEFDKWAINQDLGDIHQFDKTSDYILQGILLSTASLGFDKHIRRDALRLFTMYLETHAVTYTLYNFGFFGPLFHNKFRPVTYYDAVPLDERVSGNNRNSFYSGHVASATASTFFMAKVLNDYHPEYSSAKKYLIYGLASVPPLVLGYYRVKAMKHFPSDVMVGYVLGAICGIAVPELHRFKNQSIRWGVTSTPVGPGLTMSWHPKEHRKYVPQETKELLHLAPPVPQQSALGLAYQPLAPL